MSDAADQFLQSLRKCVVYPLKGSEQAWEVVVAEIKQLLASIPKELPNKEFRLWFPGYLFEGRKLHALQRRLDKEIAAGTLPTNERQYVFAQKYLKKIVRQSGIRDYYNDLNRQKGLPSLEKEGRAVKLLELDDMNNLKSRTSMSTRKTNQILQEVDKWLPEERITFKLRYYKEFGPLTDEEIKWLSRQNGRSFEEVRQLIEEEHNEYRKREQPLRSVFVAGLLSKDGATVNAVDVNVSRLKKRLAQFRNAEGGGP